jgi:hypothetical protein
MSAIGRNEPCPCGSGLKYKRCCALKKGKASVASRVTISLIGLMLLGGALFMLFSLDELGNDSIRPQRVWSEEHGHWH